MMRGAVLAAAFLGLAAPAAGNAPDDIRIRLVAEPAAVRPGEEFTLSIHADMPWEIGVHIPRRFDAIGPFTIVEGHQARAVPVAERRRSHATYRLQAPNEPGSYEIEGMPAYVQLVRLERPGDCDRGADRKLVTVAGAGSPFDECKEGPGSRIQRVMQGDRFRILSPPLVVVVYDRVPPDADSMEPRGLAPPVPLPPPAHPSPWRWWAALAVLTAAAGGALVFRRRSAAASPPVRPDDPPLPAGIALEALARLRRVVARESGRPGEVPVELAAVLRTYIEHRLGLPALRRTTEETMSQLPAVTRGAGLAAGPLARNAEKVLAICDLAKFAGRTATRDDVEAALGAAEAFVSRSSEKPA